MVEIAEWKNIRQLPFKNKVIEFRKSKVNDKLKVPLLVMFIHGKKTLEQMIQRKIFAMHYMYTKFNIARQT